MEILKIERKNQQEKEQEIRIEPGQRVPIDRHWFVVTASVPDKINTWKLVARITPRSTIATLPRETIIERTSTEIRDLIADHAVDLVMQEGFQLPPQKAKKKPLSSAEFIRKTMESRNRTAPALTA